MKLFIITLFSLICFHTSAAFQTNNGGNTVSAQNYFEQITSGNKIIKVLEQTSKFSTNEIAEVLTRIAKFNLEITSLLENNCVRTTELLEVVYQLYVEFDYKFDIFYSTLNNNQGLVSKLKDELSNSEDNYWAMVSPR